MVDRSVLNQIKPESKRPIKLWLKLNKPRAKSAALRLHVWAMLVWWSP